MQRLVSSCSYRLNVFRISGESWKLEQMLEQEAEESRTDMRLSDEVDQNRGKEALSSSSVDSEQETVQNEHLESSVHHSVAEDVWRRREAVRNARHARQGDHKETLDMDKVDEASEPVIRASEVVPEQSKPKRRNKWGDEIEDEDL